MLNAYFLRLRIIIPASAKLQGIKKNNLGTLIGSIEIDGVIISPVPIPATKIIAERMLLSVLEIMAKSYFL
jgi:hypothetical protein